MKLEGIFWKGMSGTEHLVQVEISYRGDHIFGWIPWMKL